MHSAATLLLAVVAAEKSKVPFFVAGGLLAAWAVVVSVFLGLRHAEFPGSLGGERVVIAISALLVAGAISMAVVTASTPAKSGEASASSAKPSGAGSAAPPPQSGPAPAPPSSKQGASKRGREPKASTGTPAPPSSPASTGASAIALAADPNGPLSFDKKQLSAKAGSVTITLTNASALEHNVTVAEGSKVLGATPTFVHGSKSVTLTLKAGTYTFYCSVPGHRQGGMEGTLSAA